MSAAHGRQAAVSASQNVPAAQVILGGQSFMLAPNAQPVAPGHTLPAGHGTHVLRTDGMSRGRSASWLRLASAAMMLYV